MKNIFKYIFSIIAMASLMWVASCEDDDFTQVSVTGKSVEEAYPGDPVSLTGDNFNTVQFVFIGNEQAPFELNGDTISFLVPEDAEVGNNIITLVMADNYRVRFPFKVLLRPIAVIEYFDAFVPVGGELVIKGTSLNSEYNPQVTIGGVEATIVSNTPTEIIVTVPGVPDDEALEIEINTIHGTTVTTTAFIARENLLSNSQLSEGSGDDFTGWTKLNGNDGMTEVTGDEAYGGGRSLRVVGAGNPSQPWATQFAADGVPLVLGEEYTVLLWAKLESGSSDEDIMRVSVSQYDGNGADYFYGDAVQLDNTWKPYSWTFTVGKDLPTHRVVLDMGFSSSPFLIDHIALIPGAINLSGTIPELLSNYSFEDDMTGWQILSEANAAQFDISTTEAYCGSQSLTATGTGGNYWDVQIAIAEDAAPTLEVGTMYELGFWAKAAGPDGIIRASVSRWCSGCNDDFFYSPDVTVAEEWTYYSFVFEAENTTTGVHQVVLDFGLTTQTFFVDAVSLKKYEPDNLYENGGFEDDMTGWQILSEANAAQFDISTTEAYEGSQSLTATGTGGNYWDVQIAVAEDAAATLEVGKQYKLSFWAKAAGPDGIIRASVSRWCSGCNDDFFYTPDVTVAEEWTYYSFVFEAENTTTGVHQVVLDFGLTTQTFFVDNINVTEFDPCE
ncbi:carbohydrate binding domain-containing protein [Abyssalbus ytuae]|uniref:Carbohydrate binding domain-containing protein n=1 Tax=Abyssalbus ytuae TaxID=2926907 RepID=A0A9E7D1Z5_9FLAO|nr:carbohydrate binding domain-containing protein [Abyssalbus ytuae]UOB16164.1 carbohydrate binding domain-containing protein [Abyssalbus ytuae]